MAFSRPIFTILLPIALFAAAQIYSANGAPSAAAAAAGADQSRKAFMDLLKMFDGQLKFPCLKKDEKILAQKSAIKEALKKLSKNITNEDVTNLLTQIGRLADQMGAQAKDTVAGMEPYSFKVQLGNEPQTVAYYELMFDAELKKVEGCFAREKSNELQNVLKRANPDLFESIYKQFLSIATFTFLINELKSNKEDFFQRYFSTDGGQTYELKKSYGQMISEN
uniref:Uncharacterized protein n=1 Tax=Globodera rostochiensis TaxID=31243 RepID=A0A914HL58_GLORO